MVSQQKWHYYLYWATSSKYLFFIILPLCCKLFSTVWCLKSESAEALCFMFNTTYTISESFISCHPNKIVTHLCAKSDAEYWRYQMVLSTWGECAGSWPCVWPWPGSSATSASGRDPSQLARWDTVMHVYFCVCVYVSLCGWTVSTVCKYCMMFSHDEHEKIEFVVLLAHHPTHDGGICIWICECRNFFACYLHAVTAVFHSLEQF